MYIGDVESDCGRILGCHETFHLGAFESNFHLKADNNKVSEIKKNAFIFLEAGYERVDKRECKSFDSTVVFIEPDEHDDWLFIDGDDDNTPTEEIESN